MYDKLVLQFAALAEQHSVHVLNISTVWPIRINSIEFLAATGTKLTLKAYQWIGKNSSITSLWLDNTNLDNKGLISIAKMKKLEVLSINNCPIDDAALITIANIKSLRHLSILGTHITTDGVAKLKSVNTHLKIRS